MYIPNQFREERPEVLAAAMQEIRLAVLVTHTDGEYQATHLPMLLKRAGDGTLTLEGHVARANPHWRAAASGARSLAIFQGPHAYISPSWYASKREHGKVVPTWNYIAVHATGILEAVEDRDWLLALVSDLTNANEAGHEHPWSIADAPAEYIERQIAAIVGLRLKVDRLEGAWKMNQHRPEADRLGTIEGLRQMEGAAPSVVAIMTALERERSS
jgi:transcriptional regulator